MKTELVQPPNRKMKSKKEIQREIERLLIELRNPNKMKLDMWRSHHQDGQLKALKWVLENGS